MNDEIRILIAKPGLDGHDKGAKVISFALRDAGMHIIYSGLHQDLSMIIDKAENNSVDAIGLSIMTGSHLSISKEMIEELKKKNMNDVKVIIGGIIPKKDVNKLTDIGVDAVFPNGTKINLIVESIQALFPLKEIKYGNSKIFEEQ